MTDTLDKLKKAFEQAISTTASVQPWNEPLSRRDAVQGGQVLSNEIVQGGLGSWVGSSGFPYTGTDSFGVQLGIQPPTRNSFELGFGLPGVPDVDFVPYAANTNRFGGKGPALLGHPISWEVVGPTLKSPYCDWQWYVDTGPANSITLEVGPYQMPGSALPTSVKNAYAPVGPIDNFGGLYVLFSFTGEDFTGSLANLRTPILPVVKSRAPYEIFRVLSIVGLTIALRPEKLIASYFGSGDGCRAITIIRPKVTRLAPFQTPLGLSQVQVNRTFVFLPPETSAASEYMPPNFTGATGSWAGGGFDILGTIPAGVNYGTSVALPVPKPLAQFDATIIPGPPPGAADEWEIDVPTPTDVFTAGRIVRVANLVDSASVSSFIVGTASNAYGYFEIKKIAGVIPAPIKLTLRRVVEANPNTGEVFYGNGPQVSGVVPLKIEVYDPISSIFSDAALSLEKLAWARLTSLIDPRTVGPAIVNRDQAGRPVSSSKADRAIFNTRIGEDPGNLLDLGFRAVFFPAKDLAGVAIPDFDNPVDSQDVILNPTITAERQFIEVDYSAGVAYLSHTPLVGNSGCEVAPTLLPFFASNNPRKELVLFAAAVPYSMEAGQAGSGIRVTGTTAASVDHGFGDSDQADVFGQRLLGDFPALPAPVQTVDPSAAGGVTPGPGLILTSTDLTAFPSCGFFDLYQRNIVTGEIVTRGGPYYYQSMTPSAGPGSPVQLNQITGPMPAVIVDPASGWFLAIRKSLRSFSPANASSDAVRGSSKKVSTLSFKRAELSFGADGSVSVAPRISLQDAYETGNTIDVTSMRGQVFIRNSTDNQDTFAILRNPTIPTGGVGAVVKMGSNTTGPAVTIQQLGAGVLIQAIDPTNTLVFSISNAGNTVIPGTRNYLYSPQPIRKIVLPFASGMSQIYTDWKLFSTGFLATEWSTGVVGTQLYFPLSLPDGAEIVGVQALLKQGVGAGSPMVLALANTTAINFAGVVVGVPATVAQQIAAAGAVLQNVPLVIPPSTIVSNATESWTVGVISSSDATPFTQDKVFGIEVSFLDPGPRNF